MKLDGLAMLYQCNSKTGTGFQILGVTEYKLLDNGNMETMNYSFREPLTDTDKLANLAAVCQKFYIDFKLTKVNNDVEVSISEIGMNNLPKGLGLIPIMADREEIIANPNCVLDKIPQHPELRKRAGFVLEYIQKWASSKCDERVFNLAEQFSDIIHDKYMKEILGADNSDEEARKAEEEKRKVEEEKRKAEEARKAEEKRKQLEKYSN